MTTALDIIESSHRKIGVLGAGVRLSAEEAADGLKTLNQMLGTWSVEGDLVFAETQENFTLQAGVASYSIGTGQTFNTTRPTEIIAAFTRLGNYDEALSLIDQVTYAKIPDKASQGRPYALYYNANYPYGTLTFHEVPDQAYTFYMYSRKELSSFASLNTTVTLPPGTERALIFNLTLDIAPEFGITPSAEVVRIAGESKSAIQVANTKNENNSLSLDAALIGVGGFNIYTGRA
jgi:hypothetical protein